MSTARQALAEALFNCFDSNSSGTLDAPLPKHGTRLGSPLAPQTRRIQIAFQLSVLNFYRNHTHAVIGCSQILRPFIAALKFSFQDNLFTAQILMSLPLWMSLGAAIHIWCGRDLQGQVRFSERFQPSLIMENRGMIFEKVFCGCPVLDVTVVTHMAKPSIYERHFDRF